MLTFCLSAQSELGSVTRGVGLCYDSASLGADEQYLDLISAISKGNNSRLYPDFTGDNYDHTYAASRTTCRSSRGYGEPPVHGSATGSLSLFTILFVGVSAQ